MMNFKKYLSIEFFIAHLVGLIFLFETLNINHWLPSARNLNLGLQASFLLCLGLIVYIYKQYAQFKYIGLSTIMWCILALIILFQPIFVPILYVDFNIFIIIPLMIMAILSIAVLNVEDKKSFICVLATWVLCASTLQSLTVFAHLFQLESLYGTLVFPLTEDRAMGNIAQPNQAAFIGVLGVIVSVFFYQLSQKRVVHIAMVGLMLLLSLAVWVTASRGGVVMLIVAVIGWFLFHKNTWQKRLVIAGGMSVTIWMAYLLNNWLMAQKTNFVSVSERIGAMPPIRTYQQEQAWLIFQDYPWLGIGFGQLAQSVTKYTEQIKMIQSIDHTHVIFSQLVAELGVLGLLALIPFFVIILKKLSFQQNTYQSYIYVTIAIFGLYSLSEYPLWYFNFLMLFVVFLALLDIEIPAQWIAKNVKLKFLSLALLVGITLGSSYYYLAYVKYAKGYHVAMEDGFSEADRQEYVLNLPQSYGFTKYRELMLFYVQPVSNQNLKEKIKLGERVVQIYPTLPNIRKLSLLYALNGQKEDAVKYAKLSCLYYFALYCQGETEILHSLANEYPEYYKELYEQLVIWKEQSEIFKFAMQEQQGLPKVKNQ